METVCELSAVPDQEFSVGWYWAHGVEVNVVPDLTRNQVLMAQRLCWIHVPHPVGFRNIKSIDVVVQLIVVVNLLVRKQDIFHLIEEYALCEEPFC